MHRAPAPHRLTLEAESCRPLARCASGATLLLLGLLTLLTGALHAERPSIPNRIDDFREWMRKQPRKPTAPLKFTAEQTLGAALFSDPNLSLHRNQSCATCHSLAPGTDPRTGHPMSTAGFTDLENLRPKSYVSKGSVPGKFGTLNAPSIGYAAFTPKFGWDNEAAVFLGGLFWNGRAGTLQEQAGQPMVNPLEMAMPSPWAVVTRLAENETYRQTFRKLYKLDLAAVPPNEGALADAKAPPKVAAVFAAATRAIAEFEKSRVFNRFTSKFDYYLAGITDFTAEEKAGLDLFVGKANCSSCHPVAPSVTRAGKPFPPLLTDFTYDNIGTPENPDLPGHPSPDPGVGGRADLQKRGDAASFLGMHKVVSLRNVAVTAPYGHNGVFPSLESIMHFYNTREILPQVAWADEQAFGVIAWPVAEFPDTRNRDNEMGALQLTEAEERAVVAFMRTLTDDYPQTGADPRVPPGTPSPFPDAIPSVTGLRPFGIKSTGKD